MTQEPMDRHEHVRVDTTPTGVQEQRFVHDEAVEERLILERVTQFIWLVAAILELMILMRVFLKLLAANPNSPFALMVYGITDLFLFPFSGLTATPAIEGSVFEIPSLIAMLVYFFAFWVLARLVWLVFERPRARSVVTYEAHDGEPREQVAIQEQAPVVEKQIVRQEPAVERRIVYEQPVVRETRVVREQPVVEEHVVVEEPGERETVVRRVTRNSNSEG
ncbi:MAG: hypothetical protein RRC07_17885 [Anaerolineae bacterium]|nr:hypothetical protein [Anaerolineae bacterium]